MERELLGSRPRLAPRFSGLEFMLSALGSGCWISWVAQPGAGQLAGDSSVGGFCGRHPRGKFRLRRPVRLWLIENGSHLLTLLVMGVILGAWV